ncbi:MAG TPA: NAD(P)H-binding protein [Thermotogota bacterium]|nr:NAD(P)H-binding protein [Thermotogota bacterium]
MRVLVLGASGATGSKVVRQLIKRNIETHILIRKTAILPEEITKNPLVEIMKGNITEFNSTEMKQLIKNCDVVISCLGHNITFKGLFGHPHYLVRDTVRSVCESAKKSSKGKVKLILMSTTAYTNKRYRERNKWGESIIFSLLMLLLPPHRDNVKAADFFKS